MATINKQKVSCMDCKHAILHRYDNNPILAACRCQPQSYDDRFPFVVEVASYLRHCSNWKKSETKKTVEQRTRRVA